MSAATSQVNAAICIGGHLEIICCKSGEEMEQFMDLARDDFISAMLCMHAANSSRKRRLLVKKANMEKSNLSLSTYVQYVEDFRFWMNVAGRAHRLPGMNMLF